jgi:hypothetical protein
MLLSVAMVMLLRGFGPYGIMFIFQFCLQRSVNAFFEATQKGGVNILTDGDERELVVNVK